MTTLHEAEIRNAIDLMKRDDARNNFGNYKVAIQVLEAVLAQQRESMAGFDRGYAALLIEALYDNGDPVSVDAAEEFERLLAAPAPQAQHGEPVAEVVHIKQSGYPEIEWLFGGEIKPEAGMMLYTSPQRE